MERLTQWNENKELLVREEERLLNANGLITKDEMYKIMRHLAEKLVKYEDAEEQGLLLSLPCKVGDTIYEIHPLTGYITPRKITGFKICCCPELEILCESGRNYLISSKNFGKTVFLTIEEAEQKLKEMEETK